MQKWEILSSHNYDGVVTSIEFNDSGIAISNNKEIHFIDFRGNKNWSVQMPFKPYQIKSNNGNLFGILMGNGFIVINSETGEQLHEGRSTQGGFSQIINRPGGGWVLSDRHEQLHIFNEQGYGIKRLFSGKIRKLIGWLDREHLLIHDGDGTLRCVRLMAQSTQRQIEEKIWSWSSKLENGELLMQSLEGEIWKGKPNTNGWDELIHITDKCLEPLISVYSNEDWWIMNMESKVFNIKTNQVFENLGHLISSNSKDIIAVVNNEGLLRIIASPELIKKKNDEISYEHEKIKYSLNSENRQNIFRLAKNAEAIKDYENAKKLYESIGIENIKLESEGMKDE
ncbi:MAG: Uncharacterised protein [Methanobacteriota archaeon]|nr:MAG: Uncharacterised protein [Euryarchaeota archaeon]